MSILDSDVGLWENHTVKERLPDGSVKVTLADDSYPEGWSENIITGRLEGDSPRQNITNWHNFVRGRINAWQDRQAAAESKRAEAYRASSEREVAAPEQLERSEETAQGNPPGGEASLEALLESKVAALRRSVALIEAEITSTTYSLAVLRERYSGLKRQAKLAEKFYNTTKKRGLRVDAPKDSDAPSPTSKSQKKSRRPRRRYGLVEGSVPSGTG